MNDTTRPPLERIQQLLDIWEKRSRDALPADAMLINRHVRELQERLALERAIAANAAPQQAAQAEKTQAQIKTLGACIHDMVVAQQAAWIEWRHGKGAIAAMGWIQNGLAGPGHIPDSDAPYGKEAQAWFDLHRSDAFPACFCSRPSNQLWMGQGFCSVAHYDQRRRELATASNQDGAGKAAGEHHG